MAVPEMVVISFHLAIYFLIVLGTHRRKYCGWFSPAGGVWHESNCGVNAAHFL